jgi:hypothetical protein
MIFIKKNILFIFLIVSVMLIYRLSPITSIQDQVNLGLSGIGIILGMLNSNVIFSKESFKSFGLVWGLLTINYIYQFTFGWLEIDIDNYLYLLAKTAFTFIIILSIIQNPKFYLDDFLKLISYLILLLIGIGIVLGDFGGSRSYLGFGNPNEAGLVAALGFGIFLIYRNYVPVIRYFGLLVLFIAVLLTGSRAAFLMVIIAGLYSFKFNISYLFLALSGAVLFVFLFAYLDLKLVVIDRILGTYDSSTGSLKLNREDEFTAGILMFKNKLWMGYGLTAYKFVDYTILPLNMRNTLGTHNGYLAAAKSYGILFLIPFLYTLLFKSIALLRRWLKFEDLRIKTHLFIITIVLIGGLFEDYFVGVNSFATNIFFVSVSVLGYCWRLQVISTFKRTNVQ